ncbi:6185_t:CDS:2 [Acaulospora colombiana]|uniref:6185_t:CDS:1 n=1 Tax=Acaulospora colombiana TaxID=27376 RepID=A0ACA9PJ92_9GLOM|nr:6185_t:CDS:2 [Acaulospora colombiana]
MSQDLLEVTPEKLTELENTLLNTSGKVSLAQRFRALFTLKAVGKSNEAVVDIIGKGFNDPSALLKHELAYVLGQLRKTSALPVLTSVLRDLSQDPMVRHEAAEAIGAISQLESIPILEEYLNREGEDRSVKETCEIALDKIRWDWGAGKKARADRDNDSDEPREFTSEDPAPPMGSEDGPDAKQTATKAKVASEEEIEVLRKTLVDPSLPLFTRYRAMFSLRNLSTTHPSAVYALASAFTTEEPSALFKHEVAFIFGQILSPLSVPALIKVLEDESENEMVRHEAAEALGGIATDDCLPVLKKWMKKEDAPTVVRESCIVAIDMWEVRVFCCLVP